MDDAAIYRASQDADSICGLLPFRLSLFTLLSSIFHLLTGTEHSIARISQAGNNVSLFIETLVEGSSKNQHIGVGFLHTSHTLGCSQ